CFRVESFAVVALGLGQDSAEYDVQQLFCLNFRWLGLAVEEIGHHDSIQHVAHHVGDALNGHFPNAAGGNQFSIDLPPSLDVDLPMLEVSWPLPVLEVGALLNQQLDVTRMLGKKCEKRRDGSGDSLESVGNPNDVRLDALLQLLHHSIGRSKKKFALAGK